MIPVFNAVILASILSGCAARGALPLGQLHGGVTAVTAEPAYTSPGLDRYATLRVGVIVTNRTGANVEPDWCADGVIRFTLYQYHQQALTPVYDPTCVGAPGRVMRDEESLVMEAVLVQRPDTESSTGLGSFAFPSDEEATFVLALYLNDAHGERVVFSNTFRIVPPSHAPR